MTLVSTGSPHESEATDFCERVISTARHAGHGWWREAAEHGSVTAQVVLGCRHELGIECSRDSQEAFHWFFLAASNGHHVAQHLLAEHHFAKQGQEHLARAVYWWTKAACGGVPEAQHRLSELLYGGSLVLGDDEASYFWNLNACRHRYGKAIRFSPMIEHRLAPEQRSRIRRWASGWSR